MHSNLFTQLKSNIEFLSKTERKIAELIINAPDKFITYSLSELSGIAGVSQGSIINFSKKYSGGGFPALKLQIASCLYMNDDKPFSVIDSRDTIQEALTKNIEATVCAFETTSELNTEETLQSVVNRILKAKKIEIYGIYRSAAVATDFYFQLLQLGIPASFVSDILTCSVSASMLDENCLVVAISASGKTNEIIDAVKYAKAKNVPVVCLTSNKNSLLAKLSDDVLVAASSGTSVAGSGMEVRSSQLILIDTICSYLVSRLNEEEKNRYIEIKAILNSHNVSD